MRQDPADPTTPAVTRRQALAALGAAGLGAAARGCGLREAREPDAVTVLVNAEPEHLDPRYPGDALGSILSRLVYGSLLDSDPVTFAARPQLAEWVEPVGERAVRARLREGVRFHDGSPLTSADVVATYRAVLDPALGSTIRGTYARVFAGVRALDPRTIEFELTGPDGTYPSLLQMPILRAADAAEREIVARPGNEARFVGAGPMRVADLSRGAWRFERVRPVAGRPRALRFLTMHDPNTLALRMLHGDADVAELKPELLSLFEDREGFTVASARSVGFSYLGLRNDHPALARREVRHAIAHAIDRDALMAGKFGRYAVASTGPLPPSHWAYTSEGVARYPYDPARATALLDRALPRPRAGAPRARLVLRSSNVRFALTVSRAIAEMLRAVGLEVDVRASELAVLLGDLRAGRYDLTVMTMPDLSDPWGVAWLFASSSRPTPANPRAGGNRWRFSDAALDAALEAGRRAAGQDARRPHYARAQQILAAELPVVPLWHADLVFAGGPRVRGLRPRGDAQLGWLLDLELVR